MKPDRTLPEVLRRIIESGVELKEIRLDRDGRWWFDGSEVEHPRVQQLFHRSIDRTEGGTWVLEVGRFTYPITVEDAPFMVLGVTVGPSGGCGTEETAVVSVRLSDGSSEAIDPETLIYREQAGLYVQVKQGRFEARFARGPYHELLSLLDEDDRGGYQLNIGERAFPLKVEE